MKDKPVGLSLWQTLSQFHFRQGSSPGLLRYML